MQKVRQAAKTEELDYLFLLECLSSYGKPRNKISALLKSGQLIRVKKGLYVFGKDYQKRPYSLEVLANLIYGPSYVSLEYALAYYDLIPEAVTRVTSVCSKRKKLFETPVGVFTYAYLSASKYTTGVTWTSVDEHTHFLIATKEKALADYVARLKPFENKKDLLVYLVEGMRIDPEDLKVFDLSLMAEIAGVYQNKNVDFLWQNLKR